MPNVRIDWWVYKVIIKSKLGMRKDCFLFGSKFHNCLKRTLKTTFENWWTCGIHIYVYKWMAQSVRVCNAYIWVEKKGKNFSSWTKKFKSKTRMRHYLKSKHTHTHKLYWMKKFVQIKLNWEPKPKNGQWEIVCDQIGGQRQVGER